MKNILIEQLNKYPKSTLVDIIKLIFQNEYGGGHMIKDEKISLELLKSELDNINKNNSINNKSLYEYIGNDIYRLDIRQAIEYGLSENTLNKIFILSSNTHTGSEKRYLKKLYYLKGLLNNKTLNYDINELKNYILDVKNNGVSLISHSDSNKESYSPHYRIVNIKYIKILDVLVAIDNIIKSNKRAIISIDGPSGSGKTTLSHMLSCIYDCNIFHTDDFFLPQSYKTDSRLSEAGGNIHYERIKDEIIDNIISDKPFLYRKYDCRNGSYKDSNIIYPKHINIIEGVYSNHPAYSDFIDYRIYTHITPSKQKKRILKRNGKSMLERFINEWIPMENMYFIECRIKQQSDIVIKL